AYKHLYRLGFGAAKVRSFLRSSDRSVHGDRSKLTHVIPALLSITTFARMPSLPRIREQIEVYIDRGDRIFASTSFQGHSVPLLHIISTIDRNIPIYYVDTGYLFPETLIFRDRLSELLGLKFTGLRPSVPKSQQRNAEGELMYTWDPDRCC